MGMANYFLCVEPSKPKDMRKNLLILDTHLESISVLSRCTFWPYLAMYTFGICFILIVLKTLQDIVIAFLVLLCFMIYRETNSQLFQRFFSAARW